MKYNINEHARAFLAEHLPEALDAESSYAALKMLYELIDEKGFDAPKYEKLNAFGLIHPDLHPNPNDGTG